MPTVAIIGTGLIGRAWANVFARSGWTVRMWDPDAATHDAAPERVAESLADLARHGLVSDPKRAATLVRNASSLADAVKGAEIVQENGPERDDAKRAIFAELDAAAAPDTILASSSSAIVSSKFTEKLAGRSRCLNAHPVNPPHLVPIVELCGAQWTSPEVIAKARDIYRSIGQVPVVVKKEIEGFVLNRLQVALLSEAFRLVSEGYITPQDLDHTIADGLGLRWAFMGPFETIELNAPDGIPDYCERFTPWFRRYIADQPSPKVWDDAEWRKAVAAWGQTPSRDAIQDKSRWRDDRLAALAAHKKAQKPYAQ